MLRSVSICLASITNRIEKEMSEDTNFDAVVRDFDTKIYPSFEETVINNESVLYKRKKFFLQDLRGSIKYLGFVLIVVVYLRDQSMLRLIYRAFIQYTLSYPYPETAQLTLTEERKTTLSRFFMVSVCICNGFCLAIHLIFGSYRKSPSPDGYLHGAVTVQFIGERLPFSRLELILLDVLILFVQLVFHNIMCTVDDSEVLNSRPRLSQQDFEMLGRSGLDSDGYNGNVDLITIDVFAAFSKLFKEANSITNSIMTYPI